MVSGEELKYQWFGPGGDALSDIPGKITGATTSNLEILDVQQGDTGKYRVSISNDGGSVNSDEATLSIGKARELGELETCFNNINFFVSFTL